MASSDSNQTSRIQTSTQHLISLQEARKESSISVPLFARDLSGLPFLPLLLWLGIII